MTVRTSRHKRTKQAVVQCTALFVILAPTGVIETVDGVPGWILGIITILSLSPDSTPAFSPACSVAIRALPGIHALRGAEGRCNRLRLSRHQ